MRSASLLDRVQAHFIVVRSKESEIPSYWCLHRAMQSWTQVAGKTIVRARDLDGLPKVKTLVFLSLNFLLRRTCSGLGMVPVSRSIWPSVVT